MEIEGLDIKVHAEALGRALRDAGKTKSGSTVLALGEYVKELELRLEQAEKDAARYAFVKTMPKEMILAWRGMYGFSDEAVDDAMQSAKESQ